MIKREVPYISYQDFLLKVLEMAEFLTYHRKKILVVFVISALLMTGLCGQLGFLMIARSDHYSKMADALHERHCLLAERCGELLCSVFAVSCASKIKDHSVIPLSPVKTGGILTSV